MLACAGGSAGADWRANYLQIVFSSGANTRPVEFHCFDISALGRNVLVRLRPL